MNDRIARLLVTGVLAVGTVLAVSWFFRNFELATREDKGSYSEEARRNPLLAAERLLQRLEVSARSIGTTELWRRSPAPGDTLVILRYQPPATAERREQLRRWVESGGHLIVEADERLTTQGKRATANGGLLEELGVRLRETDRTDRTGLTVVRIRFPGLEKPAEVAVSDDSYLEDTEESATGSVPLGKGFALLQYRVGDGLVTVLNDNGFLTNGRIGDHDHALALAQLIGVPNSGTVWLVHDIEMPSLLALGWQHLPQAIVAGCVALLLWLWAMHVRLGPLLPPARAPRRDIGEHLAATAAYFWRVDRAQRLCRRNRDQIRQAWLNKHYALRNLTQSEQCAWIGARAGLSPRAVERALYGDLAGESDFVEVSSCLQLLRSSL